MITNAESGKSPDPKSTLQVGDSFNSYAELVKKIEEFQNETFSIYKVRNCVTKKQGEKLRKNKSLKDGIEYFSIKYVCKHGGRENRQSTSKGQREAKTFQLGCEANFTVVTNKTGDALVIKSTNFSHNHQTTKRLFECLPENRRLNPEEKDIVKEQLSLGANKKKVKNLIQNITGKKVLSKDLSNLTIRTQDGNDLQGTISMLQNDYGADCEILTKQDTFEGILFVTEQMKKYMEAYPEFIGIDATYKLLDLRAPLYLVVVEDSQGHTEIVAGCILMHESYENVQWFINQFKNKHPAWNKIITVMADKDFTERDVIRKLLPQAKILICLFHTLKTFNREVTTEKLGITIGQRDSAKSIIKKMVYSKNEKEYMEHYDKLKTSTPLSVQDYFDKNWHGIREEWTLCENFLKMTFLNTTNNRLESLNGKIKTVVARFSTLQKFLLDFFILISTRESEQDVIAAYSYLKKRAVPFEENSPEYFYNQLLTQYGFKFVRQELARMPNYKIIGIDAETAHLIVQRNNCKPRNVTESTCTCDDFLSMGLPCRHIFAAREHRQLSLADKSLCIERWTQAYYTRHQRVFTNEVHEIEIAKKCSTNISSIKTPTRKMEPLKQGQKLKIGKATLLKINSLLSEFSTPHFYECINFFDDVKKRILKKQPLILAPLVPLASENASTLQKDKKSLPEGESSLPEYETSLLESEASLPEGEASLPEGEASFPVNERSFPRSESSLSKIEALLPRIEASLSENQTSTSEIISFPKESEVVLDVNCDVVNITSLNDNFEVLQVNQENGKTILCDSIKLSDIKMPPSMKMRGRPKNSTTTTPIGLPKKSRSKKCKGVPFRRKNLEDKIRQILQWLVDQPIIEQALMGKKIEEKDLETKPEKVSAAILDDHINLLLVKKYFEEDAWMSVTNLIEFKKKANIWYCGLCNIDISEPVKCETKNKSTESRSIRCDCCLEWFHQICVKLTKSPKANNWFCKKCMIENKEK